MPERPSTFPAAFRRLVGTRLESMALSRGLFIALEIDTFGEAHAEIMREACRLGASHLPPYLFDDLIDWTQTLLAEAATAAEIRVHGE